MQREYAKYTTPRPTVPLCVNPLILLEKIGYTFLVPIPKSIKSYKTRECQKFKCYFKYLPTS